MPHDAPPHLCKRSQGAPCHLSLLTLGQGLRGSHLVPQVKPKRSKQSPSQHCFDNADPCANMPFQATAMAFKTMTKGDGGMPLTLRESPNTLHCSPPQPGCHPSPCAAERHPQQPSRAWATLSAGHQGRSPPSQSPPATPRCAAHPAVARFSKGDRRYARICIRDFARQISNNMLVSIVACRTLDVSANCKTTTQRAIPDRL